MFRVPVLVAALFIAALPVPRLFAQLAVDAPDATAKVGQTFSVQGVAVGFDVVHVWAFPASGSVFLGSASANLPDAERGLLTGRFEIKVTAPIGAYPVVVYAHDPFTNTFPASQNLSLTVYAQPWISQGFGVGATVNDTAMYDAFSITMGTTSTSGGSVQFGHAWPTAPTCLGSTQSAAENPVIVTATRTAASIALTNQNPGNQTKIHVLCGGGR